MIYPPVLVNHWQQMCVNNYTCTNNWIRLGTMIIQIWLHSTDSVKFGDLWAAFMPPLACSRHWLISLQSASQCAHSIHLAYIHVQWTWTWIMNYSSTSNWAKYNDVPMHLIHTAIVIMKHSCLHGAWLGRHVQQWAYMTCMLWAACMAVRVGIWN